TARAVLVFAFEHDIGLIDTNAGRFVSRALAGRPVDRSAAQRLADDAVPVGEAWAWGQAVFDLGAAVCTKQAPRCDECPIATSSALTVRLRLHDEGAGGTRVRGDLDGVSVRVAVRGRSRALVMVTADDRRSRPPQTRRGTRSGGVLHLGARRRPGHRRARRR